MIFKNILSNNIDILLDIDKNKDWIEYKFNKEHLNSELYKFYKLGEMYYLEDFIGSKLNLAKNSSAISLKLPEVFYLNNNDKKDQTKLNNKIKNSEYIKKIILNYKLKGKTEEQITKLVKKIILNKREILSKNVINIYKAYFFNYFFISVILINLKNRENKFKLNSFINSDFSMSKNFYSCFEYYSKFRKEENAKWKNKIISYFDIFDKELKTLSILTYSLIEDLFSTNDYMLSFNEYKDKFVNLLWILNKNIKECKMKRPLVINNIYDEIENLNIKICNFYNLVFYYDRLEKLNLNQVSDDFSNIFIKNFETKIKFGNIKLELYMEEITLAYLNVNSLK